MDVFSTNVTPLRDCLATQQRELTRKNQTVRFNVDAMHINAMRIEHTYTATYNWQFIEQSSVT